MNSFDTKCKNCGKKKKQHKAKTFNCPFGMNKLFPNFYENQFFEEVKKVNKKFLIIRTNCDCASGLIASLERNWLYGPRCPHCRKILGICSYSVIKEVRAQDKTEALILYRKSLL